MTRMKVIITFEIEHDFYSELSEKERLAMEKAYIENNPHDFVENSIVENRYIKTDVVVTEIKKKL